jgi:hypothetical protein
LGLHFSDFSTIFYRIYKISKVTLLFEMRFCRQAPGKVFLLQIGPYFARNTLETVGASQCGPWGGWSARLAGIPAVRWARPTEDRRRAARGLPRLDSRAYSGGGGAGWACAAELGGGARRELGSSNATAWLEGCDGNERRWTTP